MEWVVKACLADKARLMEESQRDYKMQQAKESQEEASYRGQSHRTDKG